MSEPPWTRIQHWDDIEFSGRFRFCDDDNHFVVDFELMRIVGWDDWDQRVGRNFELKGSVSCDEIKDPLQAQSEYEGSVKWDGCSNTMTDRSCMYHSCGRKGLERLGAAICRAYDVAAAMLIADRASNADYVGADAQPVVGVEQTP